MPVFNNVLAGAAGSAGGSDGYKIGHSLRFSRADDAHLSKSPSGGNRKKWTLSFWYKPCLGPGNTRNCIVEARNASNYHSVINFRSDHKLEIYHYTTGLAFQVITAAQFRDPAAWYHFVVAYDTDQSGSDKIKIFCNGIRITEFDGANYPSDSYGEALWSDNNTPHTIGRHGTQNLNAYLAEFYWLDGIAPGVSTDDASGSVSGTPSAQYLTDFGEFDSATGIWNPIAYTGNFGAQGYYLPFSPNTTLTHPNKYKTKSAGSTPPSDASTLTYNTGTYFGGNQGVTYDAGSVRKFWVQPGEQNPVVKTSNNGTSWTTVFNGSVVWNDPIEVNCRYVYMSSTGDGFGPYFKQPAFAADASGNDNHWLDNNLSATKTPATTAHRYWRVVIFGINNSHWPRMSSLELYEADGTQRTHTNFDSDNCNDQGKIPSEGEIFDADYTNNYNFTNVGIYSTYNGGTRSGYADVYYSDDNIRWTYSFTSVVSNNAQCGIQRGTSPTDNFIDSPTSYEADSGNNVGNYASLNPLQNAGNTLSNGNLDIARAASGWRSTTGTIGMSSGKFYWEYTATAASDNHIVGVCDSSPNLNTYAGELSPGWIYQSNGNKQHNDAWVGSQPTANSGGDIIQVAVDMDDGKIWFGVNNSWIGSGNPSTGANPAYSNLSTYAPVLPVISLTGSLNGSINFGQHAFKYTPPTDFKSLCTQNLNDPLITKGSDHFQAKKYAGGSSSQSIITNFSPDFTWIKNRTTDSTDHILGNSLVPGAHLYTNGNWTEGSGRITSLNSNGFSVGTHDTVNNNGDNYISWNWDAGTVGTNEVGAYWNPPTYQTKYIGFKFPTSSGGRAVFGLIAGGGTADIYTSSDNSNWTRVQQNVTISTTDTTYDSTSQYLLVVNTTNAVWAARHYAMASYGTDAHYSTSTYPGSGASFSWTGPGYTDWEFRSVGTVIKPGGKPDSTYNQSQVWTDFWSSTNGFENNSQTYAFNTNSSNVSASAAYGDTQSLVLTTGVPYTTSVRAMTHYTSGTAYINGNSNNSVNVASGWITLASGSGTLNRIDFTSSNARAYVSAIEVDGKQLINPTPTISSTVRANTTAGFSIASWTASGINNESVAHGLNKKPDFWIMKSRTATKDWYVYTDLIDGSVDYITLNGQDSKNNSSSTAPNSDLVHVYGSVVNTSGEDLIGYFFNAVEGYSSFGTFKGNNSADGPFVYTGMRPSWVLIKHTSGGGNNWIIYDTERNTSNVAGLQLYPNLPAMEADATQDAHARIDILSNGFKVRGSHSSFNSLNQTMLYAAFAENPFKIARAR